MMNKSLVACLMATTTVISTAPRAFAQSQDATPPVPQIQPPSPTPPPAQPPPWQPPPGAPGAPAAPPAALAPNGQYVAPMSQQTQPSYVPQSVAMSGPRMLRDWQEGDAVPYGYHPEKRARKGLVIGGAITLGATYLYSGLIASAMHDTQSFDGESNRADALYIPVLGPFIQMADTDAALGRYVLAIDGLAQTAGALMLIYGLTSPRTVLIRNDLAMVTVTPMHLGKDGTGLGLVGTF